MTKITAVRDAYFAGYVAALKQAVDRLDDDGTLSRESLGFVSQTFERMRRVADENRKGLEEAELTYSHAEE
ncbi:MAG: hypothetical protein A2133_00815 [Actinobacteria bacterium RBG_16_64_13]|nr:MAG: hypothetical protein A2133_00815 [Actinobacteria bacterium RBG_16_64_13]